MSSVEKKVCIKILDRAEIGEKKYNATMDRKDLSKLEWLKHAQEEAMDLAVYLEKLIRIEKGEEVTPESKNLVCTCQPT
mgnify:CR=1 FL=1|tara:strand:+ start:7647 stop:7883 length:237 start_codon:yes stop_codon:yes gene_type:complete